MTFTAAHRETLEADRAEAQRCADGWRSDDDDARDDTLAAEYQRTVDAITSALTLIDQHTWREIASAPTDGTPFIAWDGFDAFRSCYDVENEVWFVWATGQWFGVLKQLPTHWLPAPPEAQS